MEQQRQIVNVMEWQTCMELWLQMRNCLNIITYFYNEFTGLNFLRNHKHKLLQPSWLQGTNCSADN